jgi:hypothetical protein
MTIDELKNMTEDEVFGTAFKIAFLEFDPRRGGRVTTDVYRRSRLPAGTDIYTLRRVYAWMLLDIGRRPENREAFLLALYGISGGELGAVISPLIIATAFVMVAQDGERWRA